MVVANAGGIRTSSGSGKGQTRVGGDGNSLYKGA